MLPNIMETVGIVLFILGFINGNRYVMLCGVVLFLLG